MWIVLLILLLLAAQLNVTALVPLQPGGTPPPWWVGGRLLWPFAVETHTLLPPGDLLNTLTPILAVASALCFLLVLPSNMVDKSSSPVQTDFGAVFGEETVQIGLLSPE